MKHHVSATVIFAAVIALLQPAELQAQQVGVQTFGAGHKTVLHSRMTLSREQQSVYRVFNRNAGYFGAFAVHPEGDLNCWFRNMHSLQTARQFAVGCCHIYATRAGVNPEGCVLYASIIPQSLDPNTHTAAGLSEDGLAAFSAKYLKVQKPGTYGAFAISGMAQWASTSGRDNEADAVGSAIAACEASADREIASYSNDTRQRINRQRRADCKVIHVTRP